MEIVSTYDYLANARTLAVKKPVIVPAPWQIRHIIHAFRIDDGTSILARRLRFSHLNNQDHFTSNLQFQKNILPVGLIAAICSLCIIISISPLLFHYEVVLKVMCNLHKTIKTSRTNLTTKS